MPSIAFIRRTALSLVAGGLFGLAISTSAPPAHSAAAGAGAAAFLYGTYHRFDRLERRASRAAVDGEATAAAGAGDGEA